MVLTLVYTSNGCWCRIFPKVTATEVNLADGKGAGQEKGAKWLAGVLLADGHGFYFPAICPAFSPRQSLVGRRKENVNGGKLTTPVIPVVLLKVRVESLCLVLAQQFHLVPGECLKSRREK